jgi:hypothetical protein
VAQSYSTIAHVTQTFTYGGKQGSAIQFGDSQTGDSGTFSIGGSLSIDSTSSQGFAPQYGRNFVHWGTYFEWGLYLINNSCSFLNYYEAMPYQWNGGTQYKHPTGAPGAPYCVPEHSKDHHWPKGTKRLQLCGTVNDPGGNGGPGVLVASRKAG